VEYLRTHLENQFEKEAERCGHPISWENQGEWHIDHIKPCACFDLDLEEERDKCFHYTNLQPMWGPDNISKSDTYDEAEDKRIWMGRIICVKINSSYFLFFCNPFTVILLISGYPTHF
jgi:hypothetical protein